MPNIDKDTRHAIDERIEGFAERLKSAMDGESVLSLANRSDLSEGSIRNMLKGGLPRLDNLVALAQALDKSIAWLATGENSEHFSNTAPYEITESGNTAYADSIVEKSINGAGLHLDQKWREKIAAVVRKYNIAMLDVEELVSVVRSEAEISSEFALVPGYRIEVSAGHGAVISSEKPTRYLAFRHKWLQFRGLKPENLALVFARGDSMEPTIHDNNTVMIDTSQTELIDGNIYVIRTDNHLVVKRIQKLVNKGILLLSDNKEYKEQMLEPNEANDLAVIGRVVWIGKDV